jgi:hypothetical protein
LERLYEPVQPLRVQPPGAPPDQLLSEHHDSGRAGELVSRHSWQAREERSWKVVTDVARRRRHHEEVVQEPFGRRRWGLARSSVLGQRAIGVAQHAHVLPQGPKVRTPVAASDVDRQPRRQTPRVLFEQFETD